MFNYRKYIEYYIHTMGVLVADQKTFPNGLILSNFVLTIKGTITSIEKIKIDDNTTIYRARFNIYYYVNEDAYNNHGYLSIECGSIDLTAAQVSGDIFAIIYTSIKAGYNQTTDI